ncbi:hypothetical protein 10P302A_gene0028 [Pseudomonas phage 10P302A]|uniref:Uncharacterized protein n=1 Tax=Pseudomonas phage 10P302A TaxID=3038233 RepID=A0AAF0GJ63_9CAUD|nr:hypothetical protein 10P302A_gene0028 [Pseudomonas phage 10P302A]
MAKTFKLHVSFPMSLVVSTETVKDFQEAREMARKILAENTKPLKGETKFRVELMASDKDDDEVLQTIFRAGIRQVLREDFLKEVCGNESTGKIGDMKVVYAPRCETCIHDKTCPKVAVFGCEPVLPSACPLHDDRKACTSLCKRMLVSE